jgi:hypothetical protein
MPFVDISSLRVVERLPGWNGRYFHSPSMTFAHYDFVRGSSIHEHFHPQEEVYEVIEGELEVTIDGVWRRSPELAWSRSYRLVYAIQSKLLLMVGQSSLIIR